MYVGHPCRGLISLLTAACILFAGCSSGGFGPVTASEDGSAPPGSTAEPASSRPVPEGPEAEYLPSGREGFRDIVNSRFGFALTIPDGWRAFDSSGSGDGYVIDCGEPGVDIRVFGYYSPPDPDLTGGGTAVEFVFDSGVTGMLEKAPGESVCFFYAGGDRIAELRVDFGANPVWFSQNEELVERVARSLRDTDEAGLNGGGEIAPLLSRKGHVHSGLLPPVLQNADAPCLIEPASLSEDGISITYPQLTGMEDLLAQMKINRMLHENILEWIDGHAPEPGTSLELDYQIALLTDRFLSVRYDGSRQAPGDKVSTPLSGSINIDLENQRQLRLGDIYEIDRTVADYIVSQPPILRSGSANPLPDSVVRSMIAADGILAGLREADARGGGEFGSHFTHDGVAVRMPIDRSLGSHVWFEIPYDRLSWHASDPNFRLVLPDSGGLDCFAGYGGFDGLEEDAIRDIFARDIEYLRETDGGASLRYLIEDFNSDGNLDLFAIMPRPVPHGEGGDPALLLLSDGEGRMRDIWDYLLFLQDPQDPARYAQMDILNSVTNGFYDIHIDLGDSFQRIYRYDPEKQVYLMELRKY